MLNTRHLIRFVLMQLAAVSLLSLGFSEEVEAQNVDYEVTYHNIQSFNRANNQFDISIQRKVGSEVGQEFKASGFLNETSKGKHTFTFTGPDIGVPTHIQIALSLDDVVEFNDFTVKLPDGSSVVWKDTLFFNSELAPKTTGLGTRKFPVIDSELVGDPIPDPNVEYTVHYFKNLGNPVDIKNATYDVQDSSEAGYIDTTIDEWNASASVTVTAEGGVPGFATVGVEGSVAAGFGQQFAKEKSKNRTKVRGHSVGLVCSADARSVNFTLHKITIPWGVQEVKAGTKSMTFRSMQGDISSKSGKRIVIPLPNSDPQETVIPVAWSEVEEMLSYMTDQEAIQEVKGFKAAWLKEGWVYDGKAPVLSDTPTSLSSIYDSQISKLTDGQKNYVFGGAGVLGLLGLICLMKIKAFKWKLAGLIALLVAAGVPALEFGLLGTEKWELLTPAEPQLHFSSITENAEGGIVALETDTANLWIKHAPDDKAWERFYQHNTTDPNNADIKLTGIAANWKSSQMFGTVSPSHVYFTMGADGWGHMFHTAPDGPDIKSLALRMENESYVLYGLDHSSTLWSMVDAEQKKWTLVLKSEGQTMLDLTSSKKDNRLICLGEENTLWTLNKDRTKWVLQEQSAPMPPLKLIGVLSDDRLIGITQKDELMIEPKLRP